MPWPTIIAVFALVIYINFAEAETFLIPSEYRGEFVVFYDEPCGTPAEFSEGRRLYRFSSDGVLITQHSENDGYFNRRFFMTDGEGVLHEIPKFGRQDYETEKKEWGTFTSVAKDDGLTKDTVGVFWAYGAETYHTSKKSISYIVSDYRRFEDTDAKVRFLERKRFTEKAVDFLMSCRNNGGFQ